MIRILWVVWECVAMSLLLFFRCLQSYFLSFVFLHLSVRALYSVTGLLSVCKCFCCARAWLCKWPWWTISSSLCVNTFIFGSISRSSFHCIAFYPTFYRLNFIEGDEIGFCLLPSLSPSLFLPLLSRLCSALSSIFYDYIVRGTKLEGNEHYKFEHNFKTLLRRLGFCFHFDFLLNGDAMCYFLFIGNSFACLLFCYLFHWILFILLERRHSLCGKSVNVTISYVYRVCEIWYNIIDIYVYNWVVA